MISRRVFIKAAVLTVFSHLIGCGDGGGGGGYNPWWKNQADNYRREWDTKDHEELSVFTGDSIIYETGTYYPEFWRNRRFLNAGFADGLQTKDLIDALEYIGAYRRKYKALYILSGHHDLDACSGYYETETYQWLTERALGFFRTIIERVHVNNPNTVIYLMNLPPVTGPGGDMSTLYHFNDRLKQLALSYNSDKILYEDRWGDFIGSDGYLRPELTYDAHHPNRAGAILYMDKYNV